ncbi:MAG: hypothetical protein NVSMB21_25680 [Vulcanimicrobiaceae bacterium]
MSEEIYVCCACGKTIDDDRIIFVRARNASGQWDSLPLCPLDWRDQKGEQIPHTMPRRIET